MSTAAMAAIVTLVRPKYIEPRYMRFQFLRMGYFVVDSDSTPEAPVFNRTVALRDTWTRMDQARKQSR